MLANHLNAGQRNSNLNGIKLSGLSKLTATKSSKGQTLLHFMIDRLFTKDVSLLDLETDFPSLNQVCVLSSIVMKKDRSDIENGLRRLIQIMDAPENDVFRDTFDMEKDRFEVLTDALCEKFDSAIGLYSEACEYLAEDPSKMLHEDFFKLLKTFIDTFKSQRKRAEDVRKRNEAKQKKEEAKRKKDEAKRLRALAASTRSPIPTKKKKMIDNDSNASKSRTEILMDRRKRLSLTPTITRTTTRTVLRGTSNTTNVHINTARGSTEVINPLNVSAAVSPDVSSSDDSDSDDSSSSSDDDSEVE